MRCRTHFNIRIISALIVAVILVGATISGWCEGGLIMPKLEVSIDQAEGPAEVSKTLQIVALLTVLSLAPAIMVMVTSFTRIVIVLSFLKKALSTGAQPSQQVMVGLALFLTMFIMAPVWEKINTEALQPYLAEELAPKEAYVKGVGPIREFMFKQIGRSGEKDIMLFIKLAKIEKPKEREDIPTYVLVPAFITSELKKAFQMGFVIFLPFLVIDMVVASVLLSMGMMMLPPVMISMPFKILLFILADGWYLVVKSLALSFM
jgi:flagellar biosynthesis protein FliP